MQIQKRQLNMVPQAYVGGSRTEQAVRSVDTDSSSIRVPDPLPAGKQNENIFAPNFVATGRAPKFTELLKLQSRVNRTMHQS